MAEATSDVGGAVDNMLISRAAAHAGRDFREVLAEEGLAPPAPEGQEYVPGSMPDSISFVAPAGSAMTLLRPAEMAEPAPPIGLTARGWSPEVTARDPRLIAATMAELAGETGGAATADPIDPTDPLALEKARRDLGTADVRKDVLRARAIELNVERLSAALAEAALATPAVQAALADAVADAEALAERRSTTDGPAVTEPAPAPAPTTTTKASGSTAAATTS